MTKIELSHQGFELTKDVKAYVEKKVGKLDRYVGRLQRRSVHAEVKLREENGRKKNKSTAEIILHVPNHTFTAKESTVNIFAAIDIVEAKLSNQLRKMKDKSVSRRIDRKGVATKIQNAVDRDWRGKQN
jgi:putative sigma-54 modulation protein